MRFIRIDGYGYQVTEGSTFLSYTILQWGWVADVLRSAHRSSHLFSSLMNYTLKELQQRVNQMIEQQGEDAHCAHGLHQMIVI